MNAVMFGLGCAVGFATFFAATFFAGAALFAVAIIFSTVAAFCCDD